MAGTHRARIQQAQRNQLAWRSIDLDSSIGADHRARMLWQVVERLDLSAFYAAIKSRLAHAGRPATDPKILLTLWLYATTDGVGSARELERLCASDDAYRWICGGVSVNYHTLSDFRVDHGDKLDQLLVQVLAAMTHQGLITLERVAQDGMRVRADAGAASFRREPTLVEHQRAAREHVAALKATLTVDPGEKLRLQEAARLRAAQDQATRIDRALQEMPIVIEVKRRNRSGKRGKKPTAPRVSTTDPEARVMKMPDGGFRPAYNVQLATDATSRAVVGVLVTNSGSDLSQMMPMLDDIQRRTGLQPGEHLVDGGYVNLKAITEATARGVTVYTPPMEHAHPRAAGTKPKRPDSAAVSAWRRRMERADAAQIYKQRAATAETINADLRHWRSLDRFAVRGLAKAKCQVLLNVLAHNLRRWDELQAS